VIYKGKIKFLPWVVHSRVRDSESGGLALASRHARLGSGSPAPAACHVSAVGGPITRSNPVRGTSRIELPTVPVYVPAGTAYRYRGTSTRSDVFNPRLVAPVVVRVRG